MALEPGRASSCMRREALQAPDVVARLMDNDEDKARALGERLRQQRSPHLLTLARGSSDHAAHYMAYLTMARMGRLVTSLPMSLLTLYSTRLQTEGLWSLAMSQSGQSPDLVQPTRLLRTAGAGTVAFVNVETSPLAAAAEWVFPLHAGPEISVAATKSTVAQLVAGARFVAHWQRDEALLHALHDLPRVLDDAATADWSPALETLRGADRLFVIGRGPGLAVAMEAALKFKEVCGLQAEAFSAAEVQHGPMALVDDGFVVLVFATRGPAQAGLLNVAQRMQHHGAKVIVVAPDGTPGAALPLRTAPLEDLDPITLLQSFYPMVEAVARVRGRDPDRPAHLSKVTRTR